MNLMSLVRFCTLCIASGFGSGFAKVAPGTCGSGVALIVWWALHGTGVFGTGVSGTGVSGVWSAVGFVLIASVLGYVSIASCLHTAAGDPDPSWIVIDEWAGLYVALLGLAPGEWPLVACAFVLFRVFDATKIGPVGWAENLPGAWGIMADDVVAGGLAALVILIVRTIV
jgi:phosphatidylglycerophosphatase A